MSCFIVGDEILDKVVALALSSENLAMCGVALCDAHGFPVRGAGTRLGRKLRLLNNDAFTGCYQGRHADSLVDPSTYNYSGSDDLIVLRRATLAGTVARYKALQCLVYQLSEDPVDKFADYQQLQQLATDTAKHIVSSLPEYDAAPWG